MMPGYFLNARVLTLLGTDCPDVERLLSFHTDNFAHWSANHPLAELSIPIMEVDYDIPLAEQVEFRIAWLTRKAARFASDEIVGPATKLIRDAAEKRLGSQLKSAQVIIGGQEAVIDKGVDLAGKTFMGSSITAEQVESLSALDIDLVVDCVPQPFEGVTVIAATLDALILADKGSDLTPHTACNLARLTEPCAGPVTSIRAWELMPPSVEGVPPIRSEQHRFGIPVRRSGDWMSAITYSAST